MQNRVSSPERNTVDCFTQTVLGTSIAMVVLYGMVRTIVAVVRWLV